MLCCRLELHHTQWPKQMQKILDLVQKKTKTRATCLFFSYWHCQSGSVRRHISVLPRSSRSFVIMTLKQVRFASLGVIGARIWLIWGHPAKNLLSVRNHTKSFEVIAHFLCLIRSLFRCVGIQWQKIRCRRILSLSTFNSFSIPCNIVSVPRRGAISMIL